MRRRDPNQLTDREREVLELLRRDFTNEQIAQRLGISVDGAKYHVSQILSKLGVSTREEAAAVALGERRRWWAGWPLAAKLAGAATTAAAVACVAILVASSAISSSEESEPEFLREATPLGPNTVGQYDDPQNFRAFVNQLAQAIETRNTEWFAQNTRFSDFICRPPPFAGSGVPPPPPPASCEGENPPVSVPAIDIVPLDFDGDEVDTEKSEFLLTGLYRADFEQYSGLIQRFLNDFENGYADRYGGAGPQLYSYGMHAEGYANSDLLHMTAIAGLITDQSSRGNKVDDPRRVAINFNVGHDGKRWAIESVWYIADPRFVVVDLDAASEQAKIEMGNTKVWDFWHRWERAIVP